MGGSLTNNKVSPCIPRAPFSILLSRYSADLGMVAHTFRAPVGQTNPLLPETARTQERRLAVTARIQTALPLFYT
jgi:hypothetical protein